MQKMPDPWRSNSPFPTAASLAAVSKDEVRRCYYETTYDRGVPGRAPSQEVVGENFFDIHSIGKRTSKYMEYQVSKAPLLNRLACQHSRDFTAMPLGDNEVNKQLAASFKAGSAVGRKGLDVPMEGRTVTEAGFPAHGAEAMRRARQKSADSGAGIFARTQTIGGVGYLLETQSHAHRQYKTPEAALAKPLKVILPRQNLSLEGRFRDVRLRTSQQEHFPAGSGLAATSVQASRRLLGVSSNPELLRAGPGVRPDPEDPEVKATRRAPYMSPGL